MFNRNNKNVLLYEHNTWVYYVKRSYYHYYYLFVFVCFFRKIVCKTQNYNDIYTGIIKQSINKSFEILHVVNIKHMSRMMYPWLI